MLRASAIGLLLAAPASALPPESGAKMIAAARSVLGTRYEFGGRLGGGGIDCLGVVFLAAEAVGSCGWKSFSVNPTELVGRRELGAAVPGMSPVRSEELEVSQLQIGDVLLLVSYQENPAEPAVGSLGSEPVWVWHTGLYSGGGKWIVGDHFAGKVIEVNLQQYLRDYAFAYAGALVTRMEAGPSPRRCRKHAPMLSRSRALKSEKR
ncbi:MAG: hypothetical protein HYZ28_22120 [Myxococcales bacterium]|nr:hypothetical protein [Myxococcales bacterium]